MEVSSGNIIGFKKKQFLAMKTSLINSLTDAQNSVQDKLAEIRMQKINDQTLNVNRMVLSEVRNECKQRLGCDEVGLSDCLSNHCSHLGFTSAPAEKPRLPALKQLLKYLRENPDYSVEIVP